MLQINVGYVLEGNDYICVKLADVESENCGPPQIYEYFKLWTDLMKLVKTIGWICK